MPLIVLFSETLDHWVSIFIYLTFVLMCLDLLSRTDFMADLANSRIMFSPAGTLLIFAGGLWLLGLIFFERPDIGGITSLLFFAYILDKNFKSKRTDIYYAKIAILPACVIVIVFFIQQVLAKNISPSIVIVDATLDYLALLFGKINQTDSLHIVGVATPYLLFFTRKSGLQKIVIALIAIFCVYVMKAGGLAFLAAYFICYFFPRRAKFVFASLLLFLSIVPIILLFVDISVFVDNRDLNRAMNGRGDIWFASSLLMKAQPLSAVFFGVGDFNVYVNSLNGISHYGGYYSHHSGFIRLFMLKGIVVYYLCLFSFWTFTKSITDNFKNSYATGYILGFSTLLLTDGSLFHSFGIIIYLVYPVMILISISKDRYVDYRFHYKKNLSPSTG